jgi:hypothetical protein
MFHRDRGLSRGYLGRRSGMRVVGDFKVTALSCPLVTDVSVGEIRAELTYFEIAAPLDAPVIAAGVVLHSVVHLNDKATHRLKSW